MAAQAISMNLTPVYITGCNWPHSSGSIVTSGDVIPEWSFWGDEISPPIFEFSMMLISIYVICSFRFIHTDYERTSKMQLQYSECLFLCWHWLPQLAPQNDLPQDWWLEYSIWQILWPFSPFGWKWDFWEYIGVGSNKQQRTRRISVCTHKVLPWSIFQ